MNQELKDKIDNTRDVLYKLLDEGIDKSVVLRSPELKELFRLISSLDDDQKSEFGQAVNKLRQELSQFNKEDNESLANNLIPIDITAPFAINNGDQIKPSLLPLEYGSIHPLMSELERILNIFSTMGFSIVESREIDDDWHMFESLNFPEGHPARDDYDTFMTVQKDKNGKPFIAPAHTSTMQNRILNSQRSNLVEGLSPIAAVIPGRVFRNEDVDPRHEHTFYQLEGVYVDRNISIGNLISTLKSFLESYFQTSLQIKTQPFYFPFTEPSLEYAMSCPFCSGKGCRICSQLGWIELIGCGMIHPNVLKLASINPDKFQGFAWGMGIERLVMLKHGIEDIRLFESGKLEFLRQFSVGGNK